MAKFVWWAVLAMLAAAVVPLTVWAVRPSWVRTTVDWSDRGTLIQERVVRTGLDRYGVVRQVRERLWQGATAVSLDDVRQNHAAGPPTLPPPLSQRLQATTYGNDHVYHGGRWSLTEAGGIWSVPYGLMALGLATPAALWAWVVWRPRRRPAHAAAPRH